jgi:hypothetical protein
MKKKLKPIIGTAEKRLLKRAIRYIQENDEEDDD